MRNAEQAYRLRRGLARAADIRPQLKGVHAPLAAQRIATDIRALTAIKAATIRLVLIIITMISWMINNSLT